MDLGAQLYRHWALPSLKVWTAFTLLPFLLLLGLNPNDGSLWAWLIFWWLKPLWERPLLAWYSHALFGERLSLRELFRRFPRYGLPGLIHQLTWCRLSPWRSFRNCVWQLENHTRQARRQRVSTLSRPPSNHAGTLTVTLFHLESFLSLGLMALLVMLIPWQFNLELERWYDTHDSAATLLSMLCWYGVMCVLEPLYVACGFALYLNKRTQLEGWDLQLELTQTGERRRQYLKHLSLALLFVALPFSEPVQAKPVAKNSSEQEEVIAIVAGPDFMPLDVTEERRWTNNNNELESSFWEYFWNALTQDDNKENGDSASMPAWLGDALRVFFWALFIILLIWLIVTALNRVNVINFQRRNKKSQPLTHVSGMDIRRESLPDDLPNAINDALLDNNIRGALSLLLRVGLARTLQDYPVNLSKGATEQECLRALQLTHGSTPLILGLADIIHAWTPTAWAHRPVDAEHVRRLLHLWQQQSQEVTHG